MLRLLAKPFGAVYALRIILLVSFAWAALAHAAEPTPTLVKATYKVYKAGLWIGTIDEQFTRDGDRYKIVSVTDTAGPLRLFLRDQLTVTSEGTIGAAGLRPDSYQFTRRNDQKKNISSAFDWDKQQLLSHHGGESEVFDLPVGTQDRLSAMYQFMFNVPRTTEVGVWMSQGKKAERYRYRKLGEPALTVNQESIATVYYEREAKEGESKVHLWLAKRKYYLPAKIVFEDSHGASLEQLLVSLNSQ